MSNFYSLCRQNFTLEDTFILQPNFSSASSEPDGQTRFSYADLHRISGQMANYLQQLGLQKGDRVAVQVEKSPQNLFWYFACLRAGLIYLPLNTGYQASELAHFVQNATPSLIICDPDKQSTFAELTPCPIKTLDASGKFSDLLPSETTFDDMSCDADTIAVILYTSGTTGKPKGAMISHGNLASNVRSLSDTWQWSRSDVMLHALPVFHIHGLFVATHLSLFNGSTIILLDKFTPDRVARFLPKSTVYMGVPTHYVRLLASKLLSPVLCEKMRLFTSGSAPLLPETFVAFETKTGQSIVERYGMTETGMNTSNPLDGERKPGTVGPALSGVEAKIVDDNFESVTTDSPGNLWVRGDNVFQGYWQMPEKTQEEFTPDGYFKTGDIASIDEDGYISIIGRDKDMIITGGLNVYPIELEAFLNELAGIVESAVIGLPDTDFGEAVTAIIVAEPNASLTKDDVKSAMKQNIAGFKVAKHVFFIDALPRNTMGKVQKNQLRLSYGDTLSKITQLE